MGLQVIEGTWEEIKSHEPELLGQRFRLIPLSEPPDRNDANPEAARGATAKKPKELRGYGMLAGILSTKDYLHEKREDTVREDRPL